MAKGPIMFKSIVLLATWRAAMAFQPTQRFLATGFARVSRTSPVVSAEDDKGSARIAKQHAIRDVLSTRKPHQRRDCILPGTRVLLILSNDVVDGGSEDPFAEDQSFGVETLYEATVEEVMTKEKSHPLGIKVRVVGGKSGRVAKLLAPDDDAAAAAAELGAAQCLPVTANKGLRTTLLAAQAGGKHWTPYTTRGELWVAKGPAAKAAAALEALGVDLQGGGGKDKKPGNKFTRFGESGRKKMRRAADQQAPGDGGR
jgi:uncharacterized protein YwbE